MNDLPHPTLPQALSIFWNTRPPVKDLQEDVRVGTPAYSLLWVSCDTLPSLLHADKKSFPCCYSNPFMLGTALSWRQSEENKGWEQDGVNVRQPKVICALYLEMFWYAEERRPVRTNQNPLWAQFDASLFKYSFFYFWTVCMHSNSALLWRCFWIAYFPWPQSPDPSLTTWFQILIT